MSRFNREGDYQHIPLSQIVASAKIRLRLGDSADEDIFLERYANEGARHFDSLNTFVKKECPLEIVNGKQRLPNGFHQILSLDPCNGGNYLYVETSFLKSHGISHSHRFRDSRGIFQIQDGYIYFSVLSNQSKDHGVTVLSGTNDNDCDDVAAGSTVSNGPNFTTHKIKIAYVSMNVDDYGMMVVYADMERGLVAYCLWMYMLDSPAGRYTPQQIAANEQIWIAQKRWYQSVQFQNNFRNTRREVASLANAYFVSKRWEI